MKRSHPLPYRLLFALLWTGFLPCTGQEIRTEAPEAVRQALAFFDASYGSDVNLLNGRSYSLVYSPSSHPFYRTGEYLPGTVVLSGVTYRAIPLNYDLYQQELVLQYVSYSGRPRPLVLPRSLVDGFETNGVQFRRFDVPGTGPVYLEVIRDEDPGCYLHWEKELFQNAEATGTTYRYGDAKRKVVLVRGGHPVAVGSRKAFVKEWPPERQKAIRSYLRQNGIRFRNAGPLELGLLMDHLNHPRP
ncbi:MAG: hypothetical protein R2751_01115 [Bacteroidales bacterium]